MGTHGEKKLIRFEIVHLMEVELEKSYISKLRF